MLFNEIIFGPIKSRRLGNSLGVNLLPTNGKICSFDCIYCECGFNFKNPEAHLPSYEDVSAALNEKLHAMAALGEPLDTITFAGNGEPTLHPHFEQVIDLVISLRNELYPQAKISVLSNATMCGHPKVFSALNKVDNNILKLDSGIEATIRLIDQPTGRFSLEKLVEDLSLYRGNLIIQTLFFSGEYQGHVIDNTTAEEVDAWLKLLVKIAPKEVMIYSLDRPTPAKNLKKANIEVLQNIAQQVEALGIKTQVNV